jgi:hypothetical protein
MKALIPSLALVDRRDRKILAIQSCASSDLWAQDDQDPKTVSDPTRILLKTPLRRLRTTGIPADSRSREHAIYLSAILSAGLSLTACAMDPQAGFTKMDESANSYGPANAECWERSMSLLGGTAMDMQRESSHQVCMRENRWGRSPPALSANTRYVAGIVQPMRLAAGANSSLSLDQET